MFTKNRKPQFTHNWVKTSALWIFALLFSFNLSANEFTPTSSSDSETTFTEAKCDCEFMANSFNISFRERCTATFQFEEFWEPCIEKAEWTVNGFLYSTDLNPKPYQFCSSGKQTVCLTLYLVTGEKCTFCKTFEVECPGCCNCDAVQAGIMQTPSGPCDLDLALDPQLKECIKDLKWSIGGNVFPSTFDPPAVSFTDPGPHTVILKVILLDGTVCEIKREYELPKCQSGCDCEKVAAGLKFGKPDSCAIDFKLDPDLEECVRALKWVVNGVGYSGDFCPPTYHFPGSGTYEICLYVILQDGTECRFCEKFEVECDDCTCDKIQAGIKIDRPSECSIDLELDPDLKRCIEKIEWTVDGAVISNSLNPPVYTFPSSGWYVVCLNVKLTNGEECRFCYRVEARCQDCNCEKIAANTKISATDSCTLSLKLDPDLEECVRGLKWVIDGDSYSDEFCPADFVLPGSGTYTVCLYVVLQDGTECRICEEVRVDCKECDCEDIKKGIKEDRPTRCSVDLELDPDLKRCVDKIEWSIDGVVISNDFDPALYIFPASGVYEICLFVVLENGKECKICWKIEVECPDCNCELIKDGIKVDRPSKCSIDLELDENLKPCIEKIGWYVDGVLISGDLNPAVYTFPASGTYEICLKVQLVNGEVCEFCWKVDASCPCDCEAVKAGVNFRQGLCRVDFWLDPALEECVKDLKWAVNGNGYSDQFNPPALPLPGSGVVEICLYTVLVTGEECEFCWKVEYNCPFEQGKQTQQSEIQISELPMEMTLYPNPNNGQFTVEMPHTGDATLQVTNMTGQLLFSKVINGSQDLLKEDIDISHLPSGIYVISLDLGNRVINTQINLQTKK
ncbi:MAG: T9SS type A sorting domain-containing protein [Bacteroidota bacterium]